MYYTVNSSQHGEIGDADVSPGKSMCDPVPASRLQPQAAARFDGGEDWKDCSFIIKLAATRLPWCSHDRREREKIRNLELEIATSRSK